MAIVYKFFDDRGPYFAALLTFYAFISLFPLLLLFFSALGFFLQDHLGLRHALEHSVLKDFPVIGAKLSKNVATFRGSGPALAVGVLGTPCGGLGAMQAAQAGFHRIYGVARHEQPNALRSRLRSLALLALLGSGVLLSTGVAVVLSTATGSRTSDQRFTPAARAELPDRRCAVQRRFSAPDRPRAAYPPGPDGRNDRRRRMDALAEFRRRLRGRTPAEDERAVRDLRVVLATLAGLYLQSLILMLAAEINVVRHRRLWPRALLTPFTDDVVLTPADRQAYEMYAATQRFKGFETVNVNFSCDRRPSRASRQEDSADRPVVPPRGRQPRLGRQSPR